MKSSNSLTTRRIIRRTIISVEFPTGIIRRRWYFLNFKTCRDTGFFLSIFIRNKDDFLHSKINVT
jgi:hypothetical protein